MQSLTGAYDALLAVLQGLYPDPALVIEGDVEALQQDLTVQMLPLPVPIERPTIGGTLHTREYTAQIEVLISAFVAGGYEAATPARQAALAAAQALEDYFRVYGQETLGGAGYDARVETFTPAGFILWDDLDGEPAPFGRVFEVSCTVTVSIRL